MSVRTGIGVDVHPLVAGRRLVLGGIEIPFERGLDGHSDGDALTHAIIDACLGAANLGDIGTQFPSSDERYRDVRSTLLLGTVARLLSDGLWRLEYLDATIVAERPILITYIPDMRADLARALGVDDELVSLKATTTDHLGFVGRQEGICCVAIATITRE